MAESRNKENKDSKESSGEKVRNAILIHECYNYLRGGLLG